METSSGAVSQGGSQSSRSTSSCRSRINCPHIRHLQGTKLMLLILMIHFYGASSKRNESIMAFDTARPWNKTFYKIEGGCVDFRDSNETSEFYYWPDDDPYFDHCCTRNVKSYDGITTQARRLMADDFTYGINGPELRYSNYYDLGLIDKCLPFWKCNRLFDKLYEHVIYQIPCERTDLQGLYSRRFWYGTVLKYGLLQSAILFIFSLEILVILFVALYCAWRRAVVSRHIIKKSSKAAFQAMHRAVLLGWIHLCLLTIIGNGLIEGIGRQNVYISQSKSFYNYAWLYVVLSLLLWYSSFLQQLCYCITVIEDCVISLPDVKSPQGQVSDNSRPYGLKDLEKEIGLNADWKWQPIAAQMGILFCLWGFLTYIDDNNSMAAGVFGVVVQAAAPWSGLYASKIIFNALSFLGRMFFIKMKTRKLLRLGRSETSSRTVTGWRGRGAHSGRRREHLDHNSKDEAGPATPLSRDSEIEIGELER